MGQKTHIHKISFQEWIYLLQNRKSIPKNNIYLIIYISLNIKMILLDIKLNVMNLIQNENDMSYNKSFL